MTYITGDTHGDFRRFYNFCSQNNTSQNDLMIILGDAGVNYFEDGRDITRKELISKLPITFFCIHGNHEKRPADVGTYKTKIFNGGNVWFEEEYPNILFAKDGDIYRIDNYECIVIGGAYSVDKPFRLAHGWHWFETEQPSEDIKKYVEKQLYKADSKIDIIFSHTCPFRYEPIEMFISGIDQKDIDKSTEKWLNIIEKNNIYKKWYCGHYHTAKRIDKIQFMFENIEELIIM
jgi:3-oxoacid CoA-transferase subunit A